MSSPNPNMIDTPTIRPPFPAWSSTVAYGPGDVVSYDGQNWLCFFFSNDGPQLIGPPDSYSISLRPTATNGVGINATLPSMGVQQNTQGGAWVNLTLTSPPAPFWSQNVSYQPGTIVSYPPWSPGTYWIASRESVGETPESNSQYWQRLQGAVSGAPSPSVPSALPYTPPTPFNFTAGTPGQNSVPVTWTIPAGSAISYYNLYVSTDGLSYTYVNLVTPPALSYTYTGLTAETEYFFKIESAYSTTLGVVTSPPAFTTATTSVITQSAPIQNLVVTSVLTNDITVGWDSVSPPCDSINYAIVPVTPVTTPVYSSLPGSATGVDLPGLSPNTEYEIYVYTVTGGLTDGEPSLINATTLPIPVPPSAPLTFVVDVITSNSVDLTYTLTTAVGISSILTEYSLDGITWTPYSSLSPNPPVTGTISYVTLLSATEYYLRCKTVGTNGLQSDYTDADVFPVTTLA